METMPFVQTARLKAAKVQGRGKSPQSYMSPFVIVCLLSGNWHRHTQTCNRTSSNVPSEEDQRLYEARSLQPSSRDSSNPIAAEIKVRQRAALHQLSCKTLCPS